MEMTVMTWAERVRELMRRRGINQKQLSHLSGIAEYSISRYLKSDKAPRMDVVVNVARALKVETDFFLSEEERGRSAYNVISTVIARNGGELTPEEKNRLIKLLIEGGGNA